MTFLASVAGFVAAQFVVAMYSEQFAEWYMLSYQHGFYASVAAPQSDTPGSITVGDREMIMNYCSVADAERAAILVGKPAG